MQKIKVAIIGCGLAWERLHLPAYQELQDKYEIVACCDIEMKKAIKAAEMVGLSNDNAYQDYREMLNREEVDAVDIMVPIPQNFSLSKEIGKNGINIICEKPMATNLEEAREYMNFAKEYGIQVMIAENFRYNQENNIIRDILQEGRIGEVIYFIANYIIDFPQERLGDTFGAKEWRQHPAFPGGRLLDGAIHYLAGIRHIFGGIESLHAYGKSQEEEYVPYLSTNINLKFKSGVIGQVAYFPSGKEMQRPLVGLRVFGQEGMVYLEERECGVVNIAYNDGASEKISYQPERGFYNELLNFYNALIGKEEIAVTPEVEYGDIKTILAILESIEKNKAVILKRLTNVL